MWRLTRWFYPSWYQYLLEQPYRQKRTWAMVWCRVKGHPYGVVWYNLSGDEPDMSCNGCGEDLG